MQAMPSFGMTTTKIFEPVLVCHISGALFEKMGHRIGGFLPMNPGQNSYQKEIWPLDSTGTKYFKILSKSPYFPQINPFAARNKDEEWADNPRFPNPSLKSIRHWQ